MKTSNKLLWKPGAVVGTIHSHASLRAALRLRTEAVDLLEIRVDAFAEDISSLERVVPKLKMPLIITVRDLREGGAARLGLKQRRELYRRFLPFARLIDVELRNVRPLAPVMAEARAAGLGIVASFHDFRGTPGDEKLRRLAGQALSAGADVLKIATVLTGAAELTRLLSFLNEERRITLSVMGMGSLGRLSRLVFGGTGSVLNYGYLDQPQVSGQWPAALLKVRLAELREDSSSSS